MYTPRRTSRPSAPGRVLWVSALLVLALASCSGASDSSGSDSDGGGDDRRDRSDQQQDEKRSSVDEDSTRGDDDGGDPDAQDASTAPGPMPELDDLLGCPDTTVAVDDAQGLADALDSAQPGDVIGLSAGTYEGKFVASAAAGADQPIFLCGPRDAVLDGEGIKGGYALHLDGASGWRLIGFTIRNAQKGVMADGAVDNVIQGLLIEDIGDEAIHLRATSTDNQVRGNEIRDTGQRRAKFGEGVYVGTAESNWCTNSDCEPDPSDRNLIEGNLIYGTTSESVDLKEGSADGIVRNNTFDGAGITGADSWVDAKGNDWLIEANRGTNSPQDGFQMHQIVEGWGTGNEFRDNVATVNGPGFGFATTNTEGNIISCENDVTDAGEGFADVDCTD